MGLKHLDTFSGIGGFALAARRAGMDTVGFCEIDPFCQMVLAKNFPGTPIYNDIRTLHHEDIGPVDFISGGYPCQPFSLAGSRKGERDDRHLWPALFDVIQRLAPRFVVCENVFGHVSMGLDEVLTDLEGLGYATEAFVIPAAAVDAPHRRDRVWIVADSDRDGDRGNARAMDREESEVSPRRVKLQSGFKVGNGCIAPDPVRSGLLHGKHGSEHRRQHFPGSEPRPSYTWRQWETSAGIRRVDDGLSARLDRTERLKALGNAIVPQVAEVILNEIVWRA